MISFDELTPYETRLQAALDIIPPDAFSTAVVAELTPIGLALDQQVAIAAVCKTFGAMSSSTESRRKILAYVLYGTWQDASLPVVTALTTEQRAAIFAAVMTVAGNVISAHVTALQAVVTIDVALPTDWEQ